MAEDEAPQMSVYVRGDLRSEIEAAATEAGVSVSEWIRQAAREKLGEATTPAPASAD